MKCCVIKHVINVNPQDVIDTYPIFIAILCFCVIWNMSLCHVLQCLCATAYPLRTSLKHRINRSPLTTAPTVGVYLMNTYSKSTSLIFRPSSNVEMTQTGLCYSLRASEMALTTPWRWLCAVETNLVQQSLLSSYQVSFKNWESLINQSSAHRIMFIY